MNNQGLIVLLLIIIICILVPWVGIALATVITLIIAGLIIYGAKIS